jgi:hypothetical protein
MHCALAEKETLGSRKARGEDDKTHSEARGRRDDSRDRKISPAPSSGCCASTASFPRRYRSKDSPNEGRSAGAARATLTGHAKARTLESRADRRSPRTPVGAPHAGGNRGFTGGVSRLGGRGGHANRGADAASQARARGALDSRGELDVGARAHALGRRHPRAASRAANPGKGPTVPSGPGRGAGSPSAARGCPQGPPAGAAPAGAPERARARGERRASRGDRASGVAKSGVAAAQSKPAWERREKECAGPNGR